MQVPKSIMIITESENCNVLLDLKMPQLRCLKKAQIISVPFVGRQCRKQRN
jgi:hypothetical protein